MFQFQDCVHLTTALGELAFGRFMSIFQDMAHNHFGLLALQVCCIWYVGMCLNNGLSLASISSGFGLFFCCVQVEISLIAYFVLTLC